MLRWVKSMGKLAVGMCILLFEMCKLMAVGLFMLAFWILAPKKSRGYRYHRYKKGFKIKAHVNYNFRMNGVRGH